MAGDTGTYMSALFVLFPPETLDAFVVEEFPNYRYVGGAIELLGDSVPEWARRVRSAAAAYTPGITRLKGWCDENSQFKEELKHYNIHLRGNSRKLELRVEIAREYFQNHRVWLAPLALHSPLGIGARDVAGRHELRAPLRARQGIRSPPRRPPTHPPAPATPQHPPNP